MADSDIRNVRNICILAHVDHGKTTLADHLIAGTGGGHLHPKLAGKLRFMDYLDEEQRRAITMKSSSISLNFRDSHSINLIDSPGHMDFCSEVSTAARLSDGALVLVDAVEGVHIQTHAVLRQAWIEKLTPCLVLNKIDRLISELELTPMEAYTKLLRIVHEVNEIMSGYKSEKYLSDVDSILASGDYNEEIELLEEEDEEDTFQPQKGNVAFVCALDGWGFTTKEFSEFYAEKFGMISSEKLQTALWGARYFIPKTKMIVGKKGLDGSSSNIARPMFVQFVLEPLWQVYQSVSKPGGDKVLEKVIKSFKLNVPQRELQNKDPKLVLQSVMSRWLPLSDSVLSMVIRCMPDPVTAQSFRISRLLPKREALLPDESDAESNLAMEEAEVARKCVEVCDSTPEAPCIAFVSKMFAVPSKMLPKKGPNGEIVEFLDDEDDDSDECFLAFARIFSGVINEGQKIYVLSALYDPLKPDSAHKHLQEAELQSLYLMMGQGLEPVTSVKAGNLVAIRGLGQHILKSATLSSTRNCWPFASMAFQVSPTLRVAIEPSDPADVNALRKGLKLLNRADPFVGVTVSSRGEHVLSAAGEVHLERCIKDLKERFAKVNLEVSPPLVSYRESIEGDADNLKSLNTSSNYFQKETPNKRCDIHVQVMKLPAAITKLLDESADTLADIISGKLNENAVEAFRSRLMDAVESDISARNEIDKDRSEKYRLKWHKLLKRIWAFGPGQVGPNILFTPDPQAKKNPSSFLVMGSPYVSERLGLVDDSGEESTSVNSSPEISDELRLESHPLQNSVVSGFQLATSAGPLCDEPMWGLAFVVEAHVSPPKDQSDDLKPKLPEQQHHGILQGQVMATVKDSIRSAVLQKKPRIVETMYFCELNTRPEHLGSMYAVLNRRRARVLKEEMQEGSPLFKVHAYVPVSESFGFADELRRWTSGGASALLVLSHWEAIPEDPYFVPTTEEEIEEFGDGSSMLHNTARKLIDSVRRRKGLYVEEQLVQFGAKQRTLAKKV
ncbi:Elongation factor-like GTPase 1 [Linum perenne]